MKKFYYLAYGSNLNIPQMKYRCPTAKVAGTAEITDYELLFKGSKTGSYLTIEKCYSSKVPVGVWEVTEGDIKRLDIYEGYPHFYYKTEMEVTLTTADKQQQKINAFVYIMHEERELGVPSTSYIEICAEGYRSFGFNMNHLVKAYKKSIKGGLKV